jgi:serine/threonine protein kinase
MADVHRAHDRVLGRDVAVKLLRETGGDTSDHARFVDEARTLASLSDSRLVTILDAGFTDERPFLVMELVEGPTLAAVTSAGPLPLDRVIGVGAQLAGALAYAHARGVIHRDVKPANVLLRPDGRVKLADFGIARLIGDASGHTRTGQAIGTAAYLAPEQVTGDELGGAADVYALGLVLLEALTGERCYPGPPTEAALARLHRPPAVPADLPERWRRLLEQMTALEPALRPDAAAVAAALSEVPTMPIAMADRDDVPTAVDVPAAPPPPPAQPPPPVPPPTAPPTAPPTSPPTSTPSSPPAPARADAGTGVTAGDRRAAAFARHRDRAFAAVRATSTSTRALVATLAVLLLLLVAAALAADSGGGDDDAPDDTPPQLRGPLAELRDAVQGG